MHQSLSTQMLSWSSTRLPSKVLLCECEFEAANCAEGCLCIGGRGSRPSKVMHSRDTSAVLNDAACYTIFSNFASKLTLQNANRF